MDHHHLSTPTDRAPTDRIRRLVKVGALVTLVALALPSMAYGSSGRLINPALPVPSFTETCTANTPATTTTSTIPMPIVSAAPFREEFVPVCIDGQGPFPFALDTGSSETVVSTALVRRLQLRGTGATQTFGAVGCSATLRQIRLGSWSIGGVTLAPQLATSAALHVSSATHHRLDGLIGSDVLSRFGSIELSFATHELVVQGPEGAVVASKPSRAQRQAAMATQRTLSGSASSSTVTLQVLRYTSVVQLRVPVRIGGTRHQFILDTGSAISSVTGATLGHASLKKTANRIQATGVACSSVAPLYASGPWSLGGVALRRQSIAEVSITGGTSSVGGLLGSDVLGRFPWIIINYDAGRLLLGKDS